MYNKLLTLTVLAGLCFGLPAYSGNLDNARSTARGGTGIASGGVTDMTLNPANLAGANDNIHLFSFNIGLGAYATDPDKAIDQLDDVQDDIDRLVASSSLNPNDTNKVRRELKDLDGKQVAVEVGGTPLQVAIPNKLISVAFFAHVDAQVAGSFDYRDESLLVTPPAAIDKSDFKSKVNATGIAVFDYGLTLADQAENRFGRLDFGTNIKYQELWVADKQLNVADFDNSDVFDDDKDLKKSGGINVDLGATQYIKGTPFRVSAVAKNLMPNSVKSSSGKKFKTSPQLTLGGAADLGIVTAQASIDTLKNKGFNGYSRIEDTQMLRVGAEIGLRKVAQLRAGYVHDLKGHQEDLYTAGLGFSPFDVFSIDLAGIVGPKRTYGAMFGLGLKF